MNKKWIIFCAEYLVIGEGFLFFICILQSNSFLKQFEVLLSGGMLLVIALTFAKILKNIVRKRRPLKKSGLFVPFDRYAFPSAHSASLFALAVFMLGQNIWIGAAAFIVTILVVVARVEARVHDYSDIAGGFVIGVGVVYYLSLHVNILVSLHITPALLMIF